MDRIGPKHHQSYTTHLLSSKDIFLEIKELLEWTYG